MAVVELEQAGYVFISSKFKVNKTNKFGDFELTYGSDAFSSIAEAVQEYQPFNNTMILLNSSTTFTANDAALLSSAAKIAGNIIVDSSGMPVEDYVPAKNTITIKNVSEVTSEIADFITVNIENSRINNSISKDATRSSKLSYTKNYNFDGITCRDKIETVTYKNNGKLTLKNSSVQSIDGYANVSLVNSSAADIRLNVRAKEIYTVGLDCKDEDGKWVSEEVAPYLNTETYAATGTLTFKLDKNADPVTGYSIGSIAGYKTVKISGYTDKKTPDNNVSVTAGNIALADGEFTGYAAGSVTLSRVSAGEIYLYSTVTADNSTLGSINKGDNAVSVKTSKKDERLKWSDGGKGVDLHRTETTTHTYKKDGKITLKNSTAQDLTNYNTVALTNTDAGNINNNTLSKSVETKDYYATIVDEEGNKIPDYELEESYTDNEHSYIASGSVSVKTDKNYNVDSVTVGDISGYKTVTLAGYDSMVCAGSVTGGNTYEVVYYYDNRDRGASVSGSITLSNAATRTISGFDKVKAENATINGSVIAVNAEGLIYGSITNKASDWSSSYSHSTTVKSASSFSLKNGMVDSGEEGGIQGYKSVTIDSSTVFGEINMGEAYSYTYKSTYKESYKNEEYHYSRTDQSSKTATRNGVLTVKNSYVGNIVNYNKVTVTNSELGDVTQDTLAKFTDKYIDSYDNDGYNENYDGKAECKAAGSFTMKLDKKADYNIYSIGAISGYEKVTVTGYNSNGSIKQIKVFGNITGGSSKYNANLTYNNRVETQELLERKATGSVAITEAEVHGSIYGYNTVTLSNTTVFGSVRSNSDAEADYEIAGKSVTLKSASANSICEYTKVSAAQGVNELDELTGTSGNDTLSVAQKAVLQLENIDLKSGNDKIDVAGTLIVNNVAFEKCAITGKGMIYSSDDCLAAMEESLSKFKGTLVSLGSTAENFRGCDYENADDTLQTARELDSKSYDGWLGSWSQDGNIAGQDAVDYVKLTLQEGNVFTVSGNNIQYSVVDANGQDMAIAEFTAGDYMLKISVADAENTSTAYNIAVGWA